MKCQECEYLLERIFLACQTIHKNIHHNLLQQMCLTQLQKKSPMKVIARFYDKN